MAFPTLECGLQQPVPCADSGLAGSQMKLDKRVVQRRIDLMIDEGVSFVENAHIGVNVDANELRKANDAIVVATGSTWPRDLKMPNRNLDGTCSCLPINRPHKTNLEPLSQAFTSLWSQYGTALHIDRVPDASRPRITDSCRRTLRVFSTPTLRMASISLLRARTSSSSEVEILATIVLAYVSTRLHARVRSLTVPPTDECSPRCEIGDQLRAAPSTSGQPCR